VISISRPTDTIYVPVTIHASFMKRQSAMLCPSSFEMVPGGRLLGLPMRFGDDFWDWLGPWSPRLGLQPGWRSGEKNLCAGVATRSGRSRAMVRSFYRPEGRLPTRQGRLQPRAPVRQPGLASPSRGFSCALPTDYPAEPSRCPVRPARPRRPIHQRIQPRDPDTRLQHPWTSESISSCPDSVFVRSAGSLPRRSSVACAQPGAGRQTGPALNSTRTHQYP